MHFAPEEVAKLLRNDPVTIVTDICRRHGGRIDSDELADELVPRLMDEAEWKKWWTRARTALKEVPARYVDWTVSVRDHVLSETGTGRGVVHSRFPHSARPQQAMVAH